MGAATRRAFPFAICTLLACSRATPTPAPVPPSPPVHHEPAAAPSGEPTELPRGLLLACSQSLVVEGRVTSTPGPAHLDLLYRRAGAWQVESLEDPSSNLFHKAMLVDPGGIAPGILTVAGMDASLRLWRRDARGAWSADTLWEVDFGGPSSRLRDMEVFAAPGTWAIGTHPQGVVALASLRAGDLDITELDRSANTFIHEIEVGDLNGDGVREVYASRSEPNAMIAGLEQRGDVVRYVPEADEGRVVVASFAHRHAKEILVTDMDADGRDELYVVLEALTAGTADALTIVEPVQILRYVAGTPADEGVVIATLPDRMTRFLAAGDVDGDGQREMVAASFRSGLWLLRAGADPASPWSRELLDPDSSGFEHAALLTDLDGDHIDELYVAADDQGELRRYAWSDGVIQREVLRTFGPVGSRITWNLTPFAVADVIH